MFGIEMSNVCVLPVYFQQFQNFPWLPDGWVFMGFVYYSLCINPFGEGDISEVCRPSSCCFVCRTDLWSCDCEVERKNPLSQLIRSWVGATQGGSVKNKWFFPPLYYEFDRPYWHICRPQPEGGVYDGCTLSLVSAGSRPEDSTLIIGRYYV